MREIQQPSLPFERTRKAVIGYHYNEKTIGEKELRGTISFFSTQTGLTQPEQQGLFDVLVTDGYVKLAEPIH